MAPVPLQAALRQMIDFAIRRLRPGDSHEELTFLLHRAFAEMACQGLDCESASQSTARTQERAARGECFIAVKGRQMIGTVTLEAADRGSFVPVYRDLATASVHQLAVDPANQGNGVGRSLINYAATWAGARRFERLAVDTPQSAHRQVAWYVDQGFGVSETLRVPGRAYASAVLTRTLSACVRHGPRGALESRFATFPGCAP